NGFWFADFYGGTWPANMPVLFTIAHKGETPAEPSWITNTKFTSDVIFADLAEAPTHGTFTVTKTQAAETVTQTEVVTQTTTNVVTETETVSTTNYTTLAGAGVVALIIGVAVGWLFASRKT
ncbi:MAG: hypothetical protein OEZ44_00005, partial [Candidatus Bathyarchaeota archaeon]|nr:hypothetical protein [Candidatus Bathyarchaeota archaeon]